VILVTGTIDIDPGQRDAFVEAAQKLMAPTRAEDGCEHYSFSADLDEPGRFHLSERWADDETMGAHMGTSHLAEFLAAIGPLVRGTTITQWTGATGNKLM